MKTFTDFVAWAGSQKRAAELLSVSESLVSRILSGERELLPEHAAEAERVSDGLYRADELLPAVTFTRSGGAVIGYHVALTAPGQQVDAA